MGEDGSKLNYIQSHWTVFIVETKGERETNIEKFMALFILNYLVVNTQYFWNFSYFLIVP